MRSNERGDQSGAGMGMSVPATERISQQRRTIYTYPYARDVRTKLPTTVQYSQQNKYLAPRSFLYQPTTNQPRTTTRKTAWTATTTTTITRTANKTLLHLIGRTNWTRTEPNRTEPTTTNHGIAWNPMTFFNPQTIRGQNHTTRNKHRKLMKNKLGLGNFKLTFYQHTHTLTQTHTHARN